MSTRNGPPPGTPYEQPDAEMIEEMERDGTKGFEVVDGKLVEKPPPGLEDGAGIPALIEAIKHMHGLEARWEGSVRVDERFNGQPVWQGAIQVFSVHHPQARRVFAWSYLVNETGRRRFMAILGAGPVVDAVSAVRVAIASGA